MAKRKKSRVYRITVDERLSDDLVRLLIAPLAEGVTTITDRDEDWGAEQEVMVNPTNYARQMGVSKKELSWYALGEGQVFLAGQFETIKKGAKAALEGFRVRPEKHACLRIDNLPLVKEPAKQLYAALMQEEGRRNG